MILNSPTISGSLTVTGNILTSGSITLSGSVASASYAATASFVALAQSASNAVAAATASSADNLLVRNTLTAQTLVVQTITSSVDFVTGSTRFGSILDNTHVFTGSVSMTGSSHSIIGNTTITSGPGSTLLLVKTSNNIPAITFTGATYSAAIDGGDYLGFSTSGSYKLYINASGSVGIGTTSPSSTFHVRGTFGAPLTTGTSLNGVARFGQTSGQGGLDIGFGDPYSWLQSRNATDYSVNYNLVLQPNGGNVGIGELSPASPLSVTATSTAAAVGTGVAYIVNNGTGNGLQVTTSGTAGTSFIFKARSTGVDRFWIGDTGNVGIGTSSPATKLHVSGPVGYGTSTYPQNVKFVKTGTNSVAFVVTIPYSNNWAPASAMVRVAGSRTGLEEHYAGLYLLRLTYYGGAGVTLASYFISGTDGVTFSMSANTSNPQVFTLTINDAGASTDYLIADLDISVNGGIISIS